MIWTLDHLDQAFIKAWEDVGEPNQEVITAYLAKIRRPQHPQKHQGIKRWYYLLQENPCIRLVSLGMPLHEWKGAAKLIVGTNEIIGEFPGNRPYVGKMGLQLQCQPLAWLQGVPDKAFPSGQALLSEISEQILDRREIEQSQQRTQKRYQWS